MISARFYDGKSARALEAQVQVLGHALIVYESESKAEHSFNIELLDITKGSEVVLSYNDVQIHMSLEDFKKLNIKQSFLGKERRPLMMGIGVAAVIAVILYFTHRPVIRFLAYQLPPEIFKSNIKKISETFAKMHCLSPVQEDHLKEIFGRLGKNYGDYKVYVVPDENPNAFAFPGNVMIIHDGLIKKLSSSEALAGVVAHELAHIEGKHVNIMFVRNFMIETFWAFTFEEGAVSNIAKNFSQGLFSQEQEIDADREAAAVLRDQHIDPKGTAEFFKMMEKEENGYLKYLVLSHPPYPNRIKTFSEVYDSTPVLSEAWNQLKAGCPK